MPAPSTLRYCIDPGRMRWCTANLILVPPPYRPVRRLEADEDGACAAVSVSVAPDVDELPVLEHGLRSLVGVYKAVRRGTEVVGVISAEGDALALRDPLHKEALNSMGSNCCVGQS